MLRNNEKRWETMRNGEKQWGTVRDNEKWWETMKNLFIYFLLCRITKFICTGRLSSWKLCLCPCICLCVCLCLCLCHLQMKPGDVIFPTMYDMLNPTLESWKYWCFIDDRLSDWRRRRRRRKSNCKVGTRWVRQTSQAITSLTISTSGSLNLNGASLI